MKAEEIREVRCIICLCERVDVLYDSSGNDTIPVFGCG